ncbi:hypothetical protein [Luteibacter yeojuensis]|uniref:PIN domain-containing protein n=1 Tax=Luteibacter yeojuensis TaxID=345309 RepID=A0A0F3K841_9GAMM|nr:hypothetical protein [Luteibacter yeojuensis]KJV27440.1 hypothetical protein VI08_17885 [Luteibacter yeojuensis]
MTKSIVADSGFWFGLFNARDQFHERACIIEPLIEHRVLVVPWPSLYEALNTRLMRNRSWRARMHAFVKRPSTVLLDDAVYKQSSLDYVLRQDSTTYSLVDHVIRSLLEDPTLAVNELITFNAADFADVCQARRIDIIDA